MLIETIPHLGISQVFRCIVFGIVMWFVVQTAASAAIIVSYAGGSVAAGGTGFVDVLVSSDAVPGAPDELDSFSGHFMITSVSSAVPDALQFLDPQNDSQLSIANYVFFGNSLTAPPIGLVNSINTTNDDYVGGDATLNGAGVLLDNTMSPFLLYRFDLDATLANAGETFEIALINDAGTQFLDTGFNPLAVNPISFTPFTITAAVPEPSTTAMLLIGSTIFAARRLRRRGHEGPPSESV